MALFAVVPAVALPLSDEGSRISGQDVISVEADQYAVESLRLGIAPGYSPSQSAYCLDAQGRLYSAFIDDGKRLVVSVANGSRTWESSKVVEPGERLLGMQAHVNALMVCRYSDSLGTLSLMSAEDGRFLREERVQANEFLAMSVSGGGVVGLLGNELVAYDSSTERLWRKERVGQDSLVTDAEHFVSYDPGSELLHRYEGRTGNASGTVPASMGDAVLFGGAPEHSLVFGTAEEWILLKIDWDRGEIVQRSTVGRAVGATLIPQEGKWPLEYAGSTLRRLPEMELYRSIGALGHLQPSAPRRLWVREHGGSLVVQSTDEVAFYELDSTGRRLSASRPMQMRLDTWNYFGTLCPDGATVFCSQEQCELTSPTGESSRLSLDGETRVIHPGRWRGAPGLWAVSASSVRFVSYLEAQESSPPIPFVKDEEKGWRYQLVDCDVNKAGEVASIVGRKKSGSLSAAEHEVVYLNSVSGRSVKRKLHETLQYSPRVCIGEKYVCVTAKARWSSPTVVLLLDHALVPIARIEGIDLDSRMVWRPYLIRGDDELWIYDGRYTLVKCRL